MTTKNNSRKTSIEKKEIAVAEKHKRRLWSFILFAIGVLFILFSFVGKANAEKPNGADYIHAVLTGLFGLASYVVGPLLIYISLMLSLGKKETPLFSRIFQLVFIILLFAAAFQIVFFGAPDTVGFSKTIGRLFTDGQKLRGGGVFGGILGLPLLLLGKFPATVIVLLIAFVTVAFSADLTLHEMLKLLTKPFTFLFSKVKDAKTNMDETQKALREIYDDDDDEKETKPKKKSPESKSDNKIEKTGDVEKINKSELYGYTPPIRQPEPQIKKNPNSSIPSYQSPSPLNNGTTSDWTNGTTNTSNSYPKNTPIDDNRPFDYMAETQIDNNNYYDENASIYEEIPKYDEDFPSSPLGSALGDYEFFDAEQGKSSTENANHLKNNTKAKIIGSSSDYGYTENNNAKLDDSEKKCNLPSNTLLSPIQNDRNKEEYYAELGANSQRLTETLESFGVRTTVTGVCRGPSVTRYELSPAPGVKISRITALADDIALSFAVAGVRIEAPIPGRAAVGVEVPNKETDAVPFRKIIESNEFKSCDSFLGAGIGVDITGEPIIADIAKMPHVLIAGTTGSGKSVCVNSIIMSILFRASPSDVKLLMIDPKAVEFTIYNGVPHLHIPVVTDPKEAAGALSWAVGEMLKRYKLFSEHSVRDLKSYNEILEKNGETKKPQIVIFIDELADLMLAAPDDVEDAICRLAQMARAAGIHLVIATQRPSVNVVTGVIKANIPSRIALKVASQIDSRTIIDGAGAEKLLGKGDMLYFPVGSPKPTRVQGCWVSDDEVNKVVAFIKKQYPTEYDEDVMKEINELAEQNAQKNKKGKNDNSSFSTETDDRLEEAIDAIMNGGEASISYLQRKLGLGFGRAGKIMDIMESQGIVGEKNGSKPRKILLSKNEWLERKMYKG